jgi:hypothetical protein
MQKQRTLIPLKLDLKLGHEKNKFYVNYESPTNNKNENNLSGRKTSRMRNMRNSDAIDNEPVEEEFKTSRVLNKRTKRNEQRLRFVS